MISPFAGRQCSNGYLLVLLGVWLYFQITEAKQCSRSPSSKLGDSRGAARQEAELVCGVGFGAKMAGYERQNDELAFASPSGHLRILGGRDAAKGEVPWQVRITNADTGTTGNHCSGVILASDCILTTAQCVLVKVEDKQLGIDKDIRFWVSDLSRIETWDGQKKAPVKRITVHPRYKYTPERRYNDIALVQLERPIDFKITKEGFGSVNKVCLPYSKRVRYASGQEMMSVSGWGRRKADDPGQSEPLQVLTFKPKFVDESEALYLKTESGMSTHYGDLGAPLVRWINSADNSYKKAELVGLVSAVPGSCNGNVTYTKITKVGPYLSWIQSLGGSPL